MGYYEYKVKWCVVCDQGWVEIVKEELNSKLLLQCSECFSQWEGMNELLNGLFKEEEVIVIEPNYDDIEKQGWQMYIMES
ncbi:hypothetical protein ACIQXI_07365 [Lysinibacillus sp. NPDC097195]|uniref:hypothetical protein n=1 Tax=Lysinibacillus sp. NPDC097195 TaxID=3364141 RepID=UPI0037F1DB2A